MAESLSEDEFRKALYESLSKKGVISSFRSHLRQSLAHHLAPNRKSDTQITQLSVIGDLITAAHLKHCNYEYTLSTFLSEANIREERFNQAEWLKQLNIGEDSALARSLDTLTKPTKGPLMSFIDAVVVVYGQGCCNMGVQTEQVTLQDKLLYLDKKYESLAPDHFLTEQDRHLQSVYRNSKEVEELVKLEVERFKELELERYKLLERDRINQEFNKKLSSYETEYRQRIDTLTRRELESTRALDNLKTETESSLFKERQLLLSELESARSRSNQAEREHSTAKDQVSLEQEKLKILTARFDEREAMLKSKEEEFKAKLGEYTEKMRTQCKAELRDREHKTKLKEDELQEEEQEHVRTKRNMESYKEELTSLRNETNNLNDKLVLLESQLETARSQTLHYEAKLSVTADYQTIKDKLGSLERERQQLLENVEKERHISRQNEAQLQQIIESLRGQLSRPSKTECDAMTELTKLKQRHFNEVQDLKSKMIQVQGELEREQKGRVSAQTELRDQFLECRAHHTTTQAKPALPSNEMPDFLKKYLSSVKLDYDGDQQEEQDISEHSAKLLSDASLSSDSVYCPTKRIVAGSRKLFDQLEEEEKQLEREFANLRTSSYPQQPVASEPQSEPQIFTPSVPGFVKLPETKPEVKVSVIKEVITEQVKPGIIQEDEPSSHSTITATNVNKSESTLMNNIDPVMQEYLNRVIKNKEANVEQQEKVKVDDSEHIEQVEFDKTDSDFSW